MTATLEHRPAEAHSHTHGPGCGHRAIIHGDHVDYLHDGHPFRELSRKTRIFAVTHEYQILLRK